ncbi:hypothetical protein WA158_003531 [Blastocystis sp. Blastoise]
MKNSNFSCSSSTPFYFSNKEIKNSKASNNGIYTSSAIESQDPNHKNFAHLLNRRSEVVRKLASKVPSTTDKGPHYKKPCFSSKAQKRERMVKYIMKKVLSKNIKIGIRDGSSYSTSNNGLRLDSSMVSKNRENGDFKEVSKNDENGLESKIKMNTNGCDDINNSMAFNERKEAKNADEKYIYINLNNNDENNNIIDMNMMKIIK